MQLQDFVSEVLKGIIDGVDQAQIYYAGMGGAINARGITFAVDNSSQMWHGDTGQPVSLVEFDLAVDGHEAEEGAGIWVQNCQSLDGGASRIRFAVPILLPVSDY